MAATLHASKGYPGAGSGAPALSTRARYGLAGCHRLSLSTITTYDNDVEWQPGQGGNHIIAGAAAAMSSLGSAVGKAMMVGGGGAPPLAAWLGPDWMRAPGCGTVLIGSTPLSTLNAQPPELKLCFKAWTQGASVL